MVVSAQNLVSTALVSSETGRLKVQFLEKKISALLGYIINCEWSWATKLSYVRVCTLSVYVCVWNSNVQKIKFNVLLGGNLLVGRPVLSILSTGVGFRESSTLPCNTIICTPYSVE